MVNKRISGTLGVVLGAIVACGAPVAIEETPSGPVTAVPPVPQERKSVIGRFAVVFGDPPPGSDLPAQMRYSLADEQGQRWTLVFDDRIYTPPGGILSFNGKEVTVEGRPTGANRLVVESIRLR
jgi:hypothetical protein